MRLKKDAPAGFQQVPHGASEHPLFTGATPIGLMSGEEPRFPSAPGGQEGLKRDLDAQGLKYEETEGRYGSPERSLIIHGPTREQMATLGKKYGQEAVVHSQNGKHQMLYTNGPNEGKHHPSLGTYDYWNQGQELPEDYYTKIPNQGAVRLHFDFNQLHHEPLAMPAQPAPLPPPQPAQITKYEIGHKLYTQLNKLAKAYEAPANTLPDEPAPAAARAAPQYSASFPWLPHAHGYDWHDAHTDHNPMACASGGVAMRSPQAPDAIVKSLAKSDVPQSAAFGSHTKGPTDLKHFDYSASAPMVDQLIADHGYQTYSGKPDHGRKNYDTKHLHVPATGDPHTDAYRKVHELSHALTHGEVNARYGEGKRQGKLGAHRTLKEAMRAIHWEHLATHKQREINKQLGMHVPEETFNRELNTVMQDSVHRLIHGRHTDLAADGFQPHSHKVPLETALGVVKEAARNLGLQGETDTLAKAEEKMSTEHLLEQHAGHRSLDDASDRHAVKQHLVQHHGLDEFTAHKIVNHPKHASLALDDAGDRKTLANAIDSAKTHKAEPGLSVGEALHHLHGGLQKRIDDFAQSALELRKKETAALEKKSPPGRKEEVEKLKAKGLPASEAFGIAWKQQNTETKKNDEGSQPPSATDNLGGEGGSANMSMKEKNMKKTLGPRGMGTGGGGGAAAPAAAAPAPAPAPSQGKMMLPGELAKKSCDGTAMCKCMKCEGMDRYAKGEPTPSSKRFGKKRVPGCECTSSSTCGKCLNAAPSTHNTPVEKSQPNTFVTQKGDGTLPPEKGGKVVASESESGSDGTDHEKGKAIKKAGMGMATPKAPAAPKLAGAAIPPPHPTMKPMKLPGVSTTPKMPKPAAPAMGAGTASPVAKAALEKAGPVALGQRSMAARQKFGERTQNEQAAKLPGVRASAGNLMDNMLAGGNKPLNPGQPLSIKPIASNPTVPVGTRPSATGGQAPAPKPAVGIPMVQAKAAAMPAGPSTFSAPPPAAKPKLPGAAPTAAAPSPATMQTKAAPPMPPPAQSALQHHLGALPSTKKAETKPVAPAAPKVGGGEKMLSPNAPKEARNNQGKVIKNPFTKSEYGLALSELGSCALCKKAEHSGRCM